MRTIAIEGSIAGYERLKKLDKLAEFGLELPPEATAPFQILWDPARKVPAVCLNRTPVARLNFQQSAPRLSILAGYPHMYDHAIFRALRNAVSVCDRMEKMRKALKDVKPSLVTMTFEDFEINMTPQRFNQAILGAHAVDSRVTLKVPFSVNAQNNDTAVVHINPGNHQMWFRREDAFIKPVNRNLNFNIGCLRKDAFMPLIYEGAATWDARLNAETLTAALNERPDLSAINVDEIDTQYKHHSDHRTLKNEDTTFVHKDLRLVKEKYIGHLYCKEIHVLSMQRGEATFDIRTALDIPQLKILVKSFEAMEMGWKAQALGGRLSDFPKLSKDLIAEVMDTIDFGYDM